MSVPIRVKNPFRDREEKLITALEQHWNEFGNLPSGEKLVARGICESVEEFTNLFNSEFIQKALNGLGIKTDPDLQILTPKQLAAVQIMFNFHDGRSDIKKLRDLGINPQTWDNWLRDPIFQKYVQQKVGNLYEDQLHEVDKALFLKARTGNVDAIRLVNAITGRHQVAEAPKIGTVDAHVFLMKLFEVLQAKLITQPDLLREIGQAIMDIQSPYMNNPKVIEAVPND
jgi:hypothetical protein